MCTSKDPDLLLRHSLWVMSPPPKVQSWELCPSREAIATIFYSVQSHSAGDRTHNLPVSRRHSTIGHWGGLLVSLNQMWVRTHQAVSWWMLLDRKRNEGPWLGSNRTVAAWKEQLLNTVLPSWDVFGSLIGNAVIVLRGCGRCAAAVAVSRPTPRHTLVCRLSVSSVIFIDDGRGRVWSRAQWRLRKSCFALDYAQRVKRFSAAVFIFGVFVWD